MERIFSFNTRKSANLIKEFISGICWQNSMLISKQYEPVGLESISKFKQFLSGKGVEGNFIGGVVVVDWGYAIQGYFREFSIFVNPGKSSSDWTCADFVMIHLRQVNAFWNFIHTGSSVQRPSLWLPGNVGRNQHIRNRKTWPGSSKSANLSGRQTNP